jgi:tRNA pseudouridine55 synthase
MTEAQATACGVLVVDKPRGPTSHDLVTRVRAVLGTRRVGHAGTLDPMATGVLVVAIGEATKLVPWLTAHAKSYEATLALGVETDTLDAEGRVVRSVEPSATLREALKAKCPVSDHALVRTALERERARTEQVPPPYSAIRSEGERSFVRARRGETRELRARAVAVHRIDVVGWSADPPTLDISLDVDKGYYVRALARDLAKALGTVAHVTRLRRTRSGCFGIEHAVPMDSPLDMLRSRVEPLASAAARALPTATLTAEASRDVRHGRVVVLGATKPGVHALFDPTGQLVAVGLVDAEGRTRVLRGFMEDRARAVL